MPARTFLVFAILSLGTTWAAPTPEVPPLKRLRSAQELLAKGDAAGLDDLVWLLTDAPIEVAWQAEELLRWAAGPESPRQLVGAGDRAGRQQAQAAWREWYRQEKDRPDWKARLQQKTTRPGLMVVCTPQDVRLLGFDGMTRWSASLANTLDAHMLPEGRVLVLTAGKLHEYNATGERTWECALPNARAISCQPLDRGRVFVATSKELLLIDRDRNIVSRCKAPVGLQDARLLKNGQIVCLGGGYLEWFDGFTENRLGRTVTGGGLLGRLHLMGEDRLLVHLANWGRFYVVGIRPGSESRPWTIVALDPISASPLPDGNMLLAHDWQGQRTLQEWTPHSKLVAEFVLPPDTRLVRSCLEDVRLGLDHPRPPDYDRDTLDFRLKQLRSESAEERRFAASVLDQLSVTKDVLARALIPTLSDPVEKVRNTARDTMTRLGADGMDALLAAWANSKEPLRSEAARLLTEMKFERVPAAAAALRVLRDTDRPREQRAQAVRILAQTLDREDLTAIEVLTSALRDDADGICQTAAEALGRCGGRARGAVPSLLDILRPGQEPRRSNELRLEALVALKRIHPERDAVLPILKEILRQPREDETLRVTAVSVVLTVDPVLEKTLPLLGELLVQRGSGKRLIEAAGEAMARSGEKAVPALERAVRHGNQDAALAAIGALQKIGPEARAAIPALKEAAQEEDPDIRAAAQKALQRIDRPR
jgi:hypothetical protein